MRKRYAQTAARQHGSANVSRAIQRPLCNLLALHKHKNMYQLIAESAILSGKQSYFALCRFTY
jgi:hypothetical protein